MNRAPRPRRVTIERIEIDLRGIAPASAEAAARLLGPALTRALTAERSRIGATDRVDAGEIAYTRAPSIDALAGDIAQRIARGMRRKEG